MAGNMIICFMGIDGSGKSTLSKKLVVALQEKGYDVRYTWWLEAEQSLLRTFISKLFGTRREYLNSEKPDSGDLKKFHENSKTPDVPDEAGRGRFHAKNERWTARHLLTYSYTGFVLLDYLRFGLFRASLPKHFGRGRILIFDRYYYDVIFALCREFNIPDEKRERLIQLFQWFVPDPDILLLIDIPPELAHARKSEEIPSYDHAHQIWENQANMYSTLSDHLHAIRWIRINNDSSIEFAHQCILNEVLDYLFARDL